MRTIVFTHAAAKDLDALPNEARDDVLRGLDLHAMTGRGDVKALAGRTGSRLRIGRYRVLFDEDSRTILAIHVGKRETTTYRRN